MDSQTLNNQKKKKNTGLKIIIGIVLVLILVAEIVFAIFVGKASEEAKELKSEANDTQAQALLIKENAEKKEDELKKREDTAKDKEKSLKKKEDELKAREERLLKQETAEEDYKLLYNTAYTIMLTAYDVIVDDTELLLDVWYNAIYEKKDKRTDKFVRPGGVFVSDFNDALGNLYDDEVFSESLDTLIEASDTITELMKDLKNPPESYEKAFDEMMKLYESYISFANIPVYAQGSYNSVKENYSKALKDTETGLTRAGIYVDVD